MLSQLSIRNLLLLKSVDIDFAGGLNVLTGETGAGKSILLDALGLVLGERSDTSLVRTGETQASVSAEFDTEGNAPLLALLAELELPQEKSLLLRRTLSTDGKSRAFANDAAVSVAALKRIGELLVERHGQHDQRGLLDSRTHRTLLDRFGRHEKLLARCAGAFTAWKQAAAQLDALTAATAQAAGEEEWLRQLVSELAKLAPEEGEETALIERRQQAGAARAATEQLQQAIDALLGDGAVAPQLRQAIRALQKSSHEALAPISAGLERAEVEVEEASVALEKLLATAERDPDAEEKAEDRLHALRDAARKYRTTPDALPALLAESQKKLITLERSDVAQREAQAALEKAQTDYRAAADALFVAREKSGEAMVKQVMQELKPLKMGTTRLRVEQQELPETSWGSEGRHLVLFEVATNAGTPFGPLSKVASGGELSRLLLAIKVVLRGGGAPTAIFDEIDAGTGGAIAEAIGLRLRSLAGEAQVLVVTHLPQVAAQASHHLFISKSGAKSVETKVRTLDAPARREELARMLSGAVVSEEARLAAGKLLQAAS